MEENPYWGLLIHSGMALTHDEGGKLVDCQMSGELRRLFGWFETEQDCEGMAEWLIQNLGASPQWVINTEQSVQCGGCGASVDVARPHAAMMVFRETRETIPELINEVKAVRFCPTCSNGLVSRAEAAADKLTAEHSERFVIVEPPSNAHH